MDAPTEGFPARLVGPKGSPIDLYPEEAVRGLRRRLAPKSVDVTVTSPPYNLKVAYGRYSDDLARAEYLRWMGEVGRAVARVLAPEGSFFLNVGAPPKDPWLAWDVAREVGQSLTLQNVLHWVKSIAIDRAAAGKAAGLDRDLAVGHYKPVGSPRFVHGAHEYIFHFSHEGKVRLDRLAIGIPYQDKSNVGRWRRGARDLRCRGNTWFLPYPTIRRRATDRPHPAPFPEELPERCLKLHGVARIGLALDPFLGIGSSALAAAQLGVPFVGFDLDPGYLSIARDRLRAAGAEDRSRRVAQPTPRPHRPSRRVSRIK